MDSSDAHYQSLRSLTGGTLAQRDKYSRFCQFSLLLLLLVLGLAEIFSAVDENATVHLEHENDEQKVVFEPISHCEMDLPQPFLVGLALTTVQAAVIAFAFGAARLDKWAEPVPQWKWAVTVMVSVYQFFAFFISLATMLWKFASLPGPFNSAWDQYLCLGIMLSKGPWFLNALSALVQVYITRQLWQRMQEFGQLQDEPKSERLRAPEYWDSVLGIHQQDAPRIDQIGNALDLFSDSVLRRWHLHDAYHFIARRLQSFRAVWGDGRKENPSSCVQIGDRVTIHSVDIAHNLQKGTSMDDHALNDQKGVVISCTHTTCDEDWIWNVQCHDGTFAHVHAENLRRDENQDLGLAVKEKVWMQDYPLGAWNRGVVINTNPVTICFDTDFASKDPNAFGCLWKLVERRFQKGDHVENILPESPYHKKKGIVLDLDHDFDPLVKYDDGQEHHEFKISVKVIRAEPSAAVPTTARVVAPAPPSLASSPTLVACAEHREQASVARLTQLKANLILHLAIAFSTTCGLVLLPYVWILLLGMLLFSPQMICIVGFGLTITWWLGALFDTMRISTSLKDSQLEKRKVKKIIENDEAARDEALQRVKEAKERIADLDQRIQVLNDKQVQKEKAYIRQNVFVAGSLGLEGIRLTLAYQTAGTLFTAGAVSSGIAVVAVAGAAVGAGVVHFAWIKHRKQEMEHEKQEIKHQQQEVDHKEKEVENLIFYSKDINQKRKELDQRERETRERTETSDQFLLCKLMFLLGTMHWVLQASMLQAVYMSQGMGYVQAMWVTWHERKYVTYFATLYFKMFLEVSLLTQLLTETF